MQKDRNYYRMLSRGELLDRVKNPDPDENWQELAVVLAERLARIYGDY